MTPASVSAMTARFHRPSISQTVRASALVGVGATVTMDVAGELIRRTTGVPPLDPALLGRWLGHMRRGRFAHDPIGEAEPVAHERTIGLVAHYAIGVAFAGVLLAARPRWVQRPTPGPALAVGIGSALAPLAIMQPAFGMGVAAARTPNPGTMRLRVLRTHTIYGLGLYASGRLLARR